MASLLTIDDREAALSRAVQERLESRPNPLIQVETRRLDMGPGCHCVSVTLGWCDVLIRTEETGSVIIVERKQVLDLMSSLFDGRLAEQGTRMRQWQNEQTPGTVWLVWIIEGMASTTTFRAADPDARFRHVQNPYTCAYMVSVSFVKTHVQIALDTNAADQRLLLRTCSTDETASVLMTLNKTIHEVKCKGGGCSPVTASLPRKSGNRIVLAPTKRNTLFTGDVFCLQLCSTRGVSRPRHPQTFQGDVHLPEGHIGTSALCEHERPDSSNDSTTGLRAGTFAVHSQKPGRSVPFVRGPGNTGTQYTGSQTSPSELLLCIIDFVKDWEGDMADHQARHQNDESMLAHPCSKSCMHVYK